MTSHQWQFSSRFRRRAFGWRSDLPVQRIKEAVKEIKQVARKEPVVAAEGAVKLIEKLSPALEQVDSSSGALGAAVNKAITTLVPIIAGADVTPAHRQRWLERLWQALDDDDIPYIELLGDYWGELCVTPELASHWADTFKSVVETMWSHDTARRAFYKGTTPCLSALLQAERYAELLALIEKAPFKWWDDRRWGVKALAAMGKKADAVRYAEESRSLNDPGWEIAQVCEAILLSSGLHDEAYRRYALEANQRSTYLATFRAIAKKYPDKQPEVILSDLATSTPGQEGKWFAAAKSVGLFDTAIELSMKSPTDPRTLTRAARDHADTHPEFAFNAGMAALIWISRGHGYEISEADVLAAYTAMTRSSDGAGVPINLINSQILELIAREEPGALLIDAALRRYVSG